MRTWPVGLPALRSFDCLSRGRAAPFCADGTILAMEEKDLVKAGAEGMMKPIADLLDRLAGPAAEEIGLTLRDSVRVWRAGRQLKLLQKVKRMLDSAGVSPRAIPLKVLLPAIDYASVESEEDLHTDWAGLLASAADPASRVQVTPLYTETLRMLSTSEAKLLDALADRAVNRAAPLALPGMGVSPLGASESDLGKFGELFRIYRSLGLSRTPPGAHLVAAAPQQEIDGWEADLVDLRVAIGNLWRLGLLGVTGKLSLPPAPLDQGSEVASEDHYHLTVFGFQFVGACRGPAEQSG